MFLGSQKANLIAFRGFAIRKYSVNLIKPSHHGVRNIVGDNNCHAGQAEQILHHLLRGVGVEAGGYFVGNYRIVLPQCQACDADALALTAGKVLAALADDGVKTVGQRLDPRGQPGVLDSAGELLVRKILPQADVIAQGVVKKHSLLRDIADTPIEGGAVDIPHLLPVEADVPGVAGVILEQ